MRTPGGLARSPHGLVTSAYQQVGTYGAYANNGTGYRVAADTSWFGYDLVGNLVRADNGDVRIARRYFRNGALQTDTLRIRSYGRRAGWAATSMSMALPAALPSISRIPSGCVRNVSCHL